MIKHLKNLLSPIMMALVLTVPQIIQAMDEADKNLFPYSNITSDVEGLILETAVKDNCYEFGFAGNIGSVCKAWDKFVNEKRYTSPLYKDIKVNLPTKCLDEIFYNGELIFRPTLDSDEGMIQLKISDLANSLEGTFDLSLCGDAGKYLSISTGYRKGKIAENSNKIEIWFVTQEFIKQGHKEGRAQQFESIISGWKPNAPIAIFWTWGDWDNLNWYDSLTDSSVASLISQNLRFNWQDACGGSFNSSSVSGRTFHDGCRYLKNFHVRFK